MLFGALGAPKDAGGTWDPTPTGAGEYVYTIAGTNECPAVDSKVTVSVEDEKDPGTNGTLIICFGEIVTADELFTALGSSKDVGGVWSPLPLGGAGDYTYTFVATNICPEVSADVVVTEDSAITSSIQRTDVTCFNGNNGKLDLTVSGGTGTYTFLWSNGAKTEDIKDLTAGLYSVRITDGKECVTENSARVGEPDKLKARISCGHITCHSDVNGTLDLTVTGGTPPYTYLWNTGDTDDDLSGLPGGIYTVVVTDANGCTVEQSTVITQPDLLVCNIIQNNPCSSNGGSDGVATVTVSGGRTPYTYVWDNGETSATATSLTAGVHTVTVTDALNCQTTCEIIITEPDVLICSVELNNHVLCKGDSSGVATVTVSDGAAPYIYLWDNGEITPTATSLNAGLHLVTVTDANQELTSCNIMITEPDILEASAIGGAIISCSCYGASDGSIDLTVSGGTELYTYLWSPGGETTEDLIGLSSGDYSVLVTDANGCTTTEEITIGEPGMLSCEITEDSPVSSNGGSDGIATVTPSGGTPEYTYSWNPGGATTAQATGLSAGSYTVTVIDSSGCETTCEITITEPDLDNLRCTVAKNSDVSCYDGADGSAKVTAEGGVPPYKYLWDNNEVTQTATSLNAGLHLVTVTDANQELTSCNIMITEPDILEASAIGGAIISCSCYGASDGSIDLTVSGGTELYTYLWSPGGETTEDLIGLSSGDYSVLVTDANGCTTTEEITIGEPGMLSCEITEDSPVSSNGGSDGIATVTPSGGTPEYTYSWNPGGATTAQATGLSAGSYTVTVIDSSGCETTCAITITEPDPEELRASCSYTQGFYGNPGGLACIPENQRVNAEYIMLGALNASGGKFDFGDVNTGKYFRLELSDVKDGEIFKMLPGGGPSNALKGFATYGSINTWNNVPIVDKGPRGGKIKNNLLSQTMTLYFNLNIDGPLSNYQLESAFYTAATVSCGSEEYIVDSIEMFQISEQVITYLEATNANTVQGLFDLANRALGGHDIGSLSYSNITEAVDAINNGFDECRVLLSETDYDKVVAGLTDDKPIFTIYPVPFVDTVKIKYEIDNGLIAKIQVFDLRGRLVKTVIDEDIYYHKVTTLDLNHKTFANQVYFIKVSTGDKSTMKKIISVR